MGPTNLALVKLFEVDKKYREAKSRLDSASHNIRIQERRAHDMAEKLRLGQQTLREQQSKAAQMELDLKIRDQQIEKLRVQQQAAKNNKEYQAFLIEINTRKVDRSKAEESTLAMIENVEKQKVEVATLLTQVETEKSKLETMKSQIGDTLTKLEAEVAAVLPEREAVAAEVPIKAREAFQRLADRYESDAMAGIDRPDRRKEEYLCTACNMELVRDIYNKLLNRDEVVFCPNCRRILYIPNHFTAEHAIGTGKITVPKKARATAVKVVRPKKTKTVTSTGTESPTEAPDPTVVIVEPRAIGELGKALAQAQDLSVRSAIASDTRPVECEVFVDGKLAGIYKGISVEKLERTAKYFLGEAKIPGEVQVKQIVAEEPAPIAETPAEPAPQATATPASESAASPVASAPEEEKSEGAPANEPAAETQNA